jgi:hypothetical protein
MVILGILAVAISVVAPLSLLVAWSRPTPSRKPRTLPR